MKKLYSICCNARVQRQEHLGDGHWEWDMICTKCGKDLVDEEVYN